MNKFEQNFKVFLCVCVAMFRESTLCSLTATYSRLNVDYVVITRHPFQEID
jgi:hypothetical protein